MGLGLYGLGLRVQGLGSRISTDDGDHLAINSSSVEVLGIWKLSHQFPLNPSLPSTAGQLTRNHPAAQHRARIDITMLREAYVPKAP